MQCENCGSQEAVIHLTTMKDNEMSTSHLCEACAAAKGVDSGAGTESAPLADFLAQMGKSLGEEETSDVGSCPSCGLSTAELRKTGRLGCAACYPHFEPHLRALLRRLHGGTQHVGKTLLPPNPEQADRTVRIQSLRRKLERAVQREEFEYAASLRDQIRRLEEAAG
jgi:protein arginine kinase activator